MNFKIYIFQPEINRFGVVMLVCYVEGGLSVVTPCIKCPKCPEFLKFLVIKILMPYL